MSEPGIAYRADIDGLRAIAVLAVVLYHLKLPGFGAGFVGVDIFFTISGFLIFSILYTEFAANGRVDWLGFYARRIRRLLPEATVMIVTVMALGYFVLLSDGAQQSLAKSGIAGALWMGNIYFWRYGAGDYFSPVAERQPLLHLWSLGVEEQFYLLVPLLFALVAILRVRLRAAWQHLFWIFLLAGGSISLAVAVWGANAYPTAAYYLLPTRAYEFALGALAALVLNRSRETGGRSRLIHAAALLGLAGIGLSLTITEKGVAFPGAWALFPTVGTALLLWSGDSVVRTHVRRFLEARVAVYLGKISYGWYLWHFPLLVLWREYWLYDTSARAEIAIALAALGPAAVGYHLVARLRRENTGAAMFQRARRTLRYGAVAASAAVLACASLGAYARFVGSESVETLTLARQVKDRYLPPNPCLDATRNYTVGECAFGDPTGAMTLLLWGDSHANHWVPALEPIFRQAGILGIERFRGGCPPSLRQNTLMDADRLAPCKEFGEAVLIELEQRKRMGPIGVILSARWAAHINLDPLSIMDQVIPRPKLAGGPAIEQSLKQLMTALSSLHIPVGILLTVPEQKFSLPHCARRMALDQCEVSSAEEHAYLASSQEVIARAAGDALLLDPAKILCLGRKCAVTHGTTLLYHDDNHLSQSGARSLTPHLVGFVQTLAGQVRAASQP